MSSPAAATPPRGGLVVLALFLVYVVWGSTYLAIRFALEGGALPLTMVSGARFIVAGGLMYAVLRWRGVPAPTRAQWKKVAFMGLTLLLLGNGMVVLAERDVSSGLAATAVASVPLWMALFSALRGQRSTRGEWAGIAIGFLGVVWLNAGSSLTATPLGLVLLLIAPLGWAFGSVWSRGRDLPSPFMTAAAQMLCGGVLLVATIAWSFGSVWSRGRDLASPFMTAAAQMLCGGVAMLAIALASGERLHAVPSAAGIAAFAYLVVFGSLLGFSAYVWLLHHVRPALAGSYAYVNPVIAVALGAWLAHERFTAAEFGAMAVILAGVVVISVGKLKKPAAGKPA